MKEKGKESGSKSIVIGLVGDVMLGRLVNEKISETNYRYPWGNVIEMLRDNDLNVVNLETTLTRSEQKVPKIFNFKASPDKVQCLKEAGIDIVNLANNHILDFGEEGLKETIITLDRVGIKHVGAGENDEEASEAVVVEKKGLKIGILGYTDNEPGWQASESECGTNYIEIGVSKDLEEVERAVRELKSKVDLVIFSIHLGPNMVERPSEKFRNFAHSIIDAGADIFHGHSSHIFQGIEAYKSKLIIYDAGDFVDDYAVDPVLRNDRSFLFLVRVSKTRVKKVKLVPVLILEMQVNKAKGEEYRKIVERMRMLSDEFGTRVEEGARGMFVRIK